MNIEAIFIDMDDTLYPTNSGLWGEIRSRIYQFISDTIRVTYDEARQMSAVYVAEYGTTFRGLSAHYAIDPTKYFQVVHDIDLSKYIQPAPELEELLKSLPPKKYIFTNADAAHANRALKVMGLEDCFEGVIDIHMLEPNCKPQQVAFEKAMAFAGVEDTAKCVFVDDLVPNARSAADMGMLSILFGEKNADVECENCEKMSAWQEFPHILRARGYAG